ncbi:MAG: DUF4163 domain-containing protein [Flavobacteriaceae bacterium]
MKFPSRFAVFLLLFWGCKEKPMLSFTLEGFTEKELAICENDPCAKVTIDYVKASGESPMAKKINATMEAFIIEKLFLDRGKSPSAKTMEEAAQQFVLSEKDSNYLNEFEVPSEASVAISELFQNRRLMSLQCNSYFYTGGAHGYGSTSFKNFDLDSGEELPLEELFKNYRTFLKFAEEKFREAYHIPKEESINASGFDFGEAIFSLPDTMGVDSENLIFVYNPYEIASYAEGPIELRISLKEANPYLNTPYFNE